MSLLDASSGSKAVPVAGRAMGIPLPGPGERRSAARGVAWGGVESAATALVGLLLTPLIVRSAGIEGLGLWSATWSMAHTAGLFDLGVGGSYAPFTARAIARGDIEALNGTVGAGVGFHLGLSALVVLGALLFGSTAVAALAPRGDLARQAPGILAAVVAIVLLRISLSAYRGVVAGCQRLDLLGRIGAITTILEGIGGALLLLSGAGLRGLAMNSLAAAALATTAEAVAAHRLCPGLRLRPFCARRSDWGAVFSFGLRLQATRAAEILTAHAPRLALALGPGLLTAGAYDLGARAAGALQIAGALPLPVVVPLASRLDARGDRDRLQALVERATRYVALLALPATAILLVDAPAVLSAWTGRTLPPGAGASARWLAVAITVFLLVSPTRLVLRGMGRPGVEAAAVCAGALLNLMMAIPFAFRFGAPGVACAALAGALLSATILGLGARRVGSALSGRSARASLGAPLLAAAAAVLAGGSLRLMAGHETGHFVSRLDSVAHIIPEALCCGSAFLLISILTGGIRREDLAVVREVRTERGGVAA